MHPRERRYMVKCVKICGQDFQNEVSYDIKIQRQPISWEIFK